MDAREKKEFDRVVRWAARLSKAMQQEIAQLIAEGVKCPRCGYLHNPKRRFPARDRRKATP